MNKLEALQAGVENITVVNAIKQGYKVIGIQVMDCYQAVEPKHIHLGDNGIIIHVKNCGPDVGLFDVEYIVLDQEFELPTDRNNIAVDVLLTSGHEATLFMMAGN